MTKENYSNEFLLGLYRKMTLIRKFEERVKFLFLEGIMPGTIHQYQGQEACAVGVCSALNADDVITSTHRPHGHCIAKGLPIKEMMAELFGRVTGCCKGKGGSMHMGDLSKGVVPAIAIVGGNVPMTTGIALSFKLKKEARVAVSFMGDGAVNEGAFLEGVNMGAIWNLPVVYVIENNLYAASTSVKMAVKLKNLAERASAFGIPGVTVDGNDVLAVFETAHEAIERARSGKGPTLLELVTYRITGHSRRDTSMYQPDDEKKAALMNEPICRFKKYLQEENVATEELFNRIDEAINIEIEDAVKSAMSDPEPKPGDVFNDLFVEQ